MIPPAPSDEALVQLMAQGRTDALSALYNRYARLVYGLALHMVDDQATAEEIAQDVFYRAWENASTYRPEQAKVTTWITSITRHRAIDSLRRRRARPHHDDLSWAEAALDLVPDGVGEPEELVVTAMERQRVRGAVRSLSREQREVLALAYFKGLSHSEIAASLQQPLGTVKTRIRAAVQKLRELLGDEARTEEEIR